MAQDSAFVFQPTVEQKLVLALLGFAADGSDGELIFGLLDQVSWTEFLGVTEYALYPYLLYALDKLRALNAVPHEVRHQFVRARQATIIRQMRRHRDLRELLQMLERRGIPVIVLKGAALTYLVYPDPYMRPMSDLDLLVPAAQMKSAQETAQDLGFALPVPSEYILPHPNGHPDKEELLMTRRAQGIGEIVEFHGAICSSRPPFRLDLESLWRRSRQVGLNGIPARVLHPHDFLNHICLHVSFSHNFVRSLHWLLDIRLCIEHWKEDLDWNKLADECIQQGNAPFVFLTLRLAHDLLHANVPMKFFESLPTPPNLQQVEAIAWDQLWYSGVLGNPANLLISIYESGSLRPGVAFVVKRVQAWTSSDSTSGNGKTRKGFQLRTALHRVWWDVRAQAHRYIYNFKQGGYSRSNLRLAVDVKNRRKRFKKLMEDPVNPVVDA